VPWILTSYPPAFKDLCRVYREVAAENGRQLGLGENVGAFRAVHFGRTENEAVELFRTTNYVKYALAGTAEQVRAEIAAVQSVYDGGNLEWFGWFFDQGVMPWDEEVRQIELFANHIIPNFR
jgi:hypothetical protein